ncbi:Hypothetical protein SMAX5B_019084 [Scophthalmus maximus]|uniref:Uncharacterized protein n=1 Tax=Scophthalmus maximus TaxID=52904 RepID=A0A2U9C8G4_SCOMX|nr:Hypothetical protein SMAX5B_019084 [Scophthalmus maximus]
MGRPARAHEGMTTENRFQVCLALFALTEHEVLVCRSLLKNETSLNTVSPEWRSGPPVPLSEAVQTGKERKEGMIVCSYET